MTFLIQMLFLLFILSQHPSDAIIGYDCGHRSANITTVSLLNVDECDIPSLDVNVTLVNIQLLQINEFDSTTVIQCKVEIDRTVKKCGMFSHNSDVLNGHYAYLEEINRDLCSEMHRYGQMQISGTVIRGLKPNHTISRPITFAGMVDNEGKCGGASYSDPYGSWDNVIVTGFVKITLRSYVATVRINTRKIHLQSGVICELGDGKCIDLDGGNTYWDSLPTDSCDFSKYGILYEGAANKARDTLNDNEQTVYSLTTQDIVFALATKSQYTICGYTLLKTEHPKLLIFETKDGNRFASKKKVGAVNLDIFTYLNSKFVYVEKHIRTQIKQLYRDVMSHHCELEQKTLKNALSIAIQAPDIFAYHLMKGPGYMAVAAGEVIHIVKCIPVEVAIARTTECYNELPVLRGNKILFLTPQTHILFEQATQVTCNTLVPPMYHLENSWYKLTPKPMESLPPIVMKPMTKPTWKYTNPGDLSTSGIYTERDLNELRDHIMFPAEKHSILNTIARKAVGKSTIPQGILFSNLLDEKTIKIITTNAWGEMWGRLLKFGNISAAVLGIVVIMQGIKLIIDTIIHGYALHSVYGCSLYLLGAIWDAVTHLLLHLARRPTSYNQKCKMKDKDLENGLVEMGDNPSTKATTSNEYNPSSHGSLNAVTITMP